jgi:hypothetical protein
MVLNSVVDRKENIKLVRIIDCEVWSRVVGYYRPVQAFNLGKRLEFDQRKFIVLADSEVEKKINARPI